MSPANSPVRLFAAALDEERYEALPELLSAGCEYVIRGEILRGPEAIIGSYRAAGDWAGRAFDSISYESRVVCLGENRWRIRFVDLTMHRGVGHRHECEQRVRVDERGLIARIEHIDLPGERDRLDAYLREVGVRRES